MSAPVPLAEIWRGDFLESLHLGHAVICDGSGVSGQLTFTGGYPFASGSTVNMNISGTTFELFTDGEWAWPATPADDAKIITAMKRGSSAILTARSGRGTETKDTFSLLGFTASVEDSEKRCK